MSGNDIINDGTWGRIGDRLEELKQSSDLLHQIHVAKAPVFGVDCKAATHQVFYDARDVLGAALMAAKTEPGFGFSYIAAPIGDPPDEIPEDAHPDADFGPPADVGDGPGRVDFYESSEVEGDIRRITIKAVIQVKCNG